MKRTLSILLSFSIIITLLTGCGLLSSVSLGDTAKVNFYVDGEIYKSVSVQRGHSVDMLEAPAKENQIFIGWYTDGLFSTEFDFSDEVFLDINLYAKYTIDAISATDMVHNRAILSVVTVYNRSFNLAMGGLIETDYATVQGSGVVINISSSGYCYVITNCHVAQTVEGFENSTLKIEDPWGNTYDATIYKNKNKSEQAISEDYDLALLCFKYEPKDEHRLMAMGVADKDPVIGEYVISLGTPEGMKNTVTYGLINRYGRVNVAEDGKLEGIQFDVIIHSSDINHGSSGGPLLNLRGELVGLNFAGFESGGSGCAIPISKINEFLDIYVYVE